MSRLKISAIVAAFAAVHTIGSVAAEDRPDINPDSTARDGLGSAVLQAPPHRETGPAPAANELPVELARVIDVLTNKKALTGLTPETAQATLRESLGQFAENGRSESGVDLDLVNGVNAAIKSARLSFAQAATAAGDAIPGRYKFEWLSVAISGDPSLCDSAKSDLTKRLGRARRISPSKRNPSTWSWVLKKDWRVVLSKGDADDMKRGIVAHVTSTAHTDESD